jgi:hypothetical protein
MRQVRWNSCMRTSRRAGAFAALSLIVAPAILTNASSVPGWRQDRAWLVHEGATPAP